MRIDFHGLIFETPHISVYLWTPWRASALEHRLFDAVKQATRAEVEEKPDELRLDVHDPKAWRGAVQALVRVLKGWQEEADAGRERRAFRWLLEGDCDHHGFDSLGERLSLWLFLRLTVDRGGPDDGDKQEEIDLQGFGIRIWSEAGNN
jgi:hypothetical protein